MKQTRSVHGDGAASALRPYQLQAIARVRQAMSQGRRRVCLVMPTGSGKTVTCAEIVRRAVALGRSALWLAHRAELIDQAHATLSALGLTAGAVCATAGAPPNPFAPVQVASVQTLLARKRRPRADLIVFDEAHHCADACEEWSALLADYPRAFVVGPTATPERGDGCGLGSTFDAIVVGATVRQLTSDGYLVPCVSLGPDRPLRPGEIAQHPVDAYLEHASGRSAIVFARSVTLGEQYTQEFVARGLVARCVSAETPWAERRLYIDAFRSGAIRVLVNVYVLTEGFDAPEASCCILVRGAGSAGLYLQMVGRVLRPAPGKRDALLLDLRGIRHEHGLPEDERTFSLQGRGIRMRDPQTYCPVCGSPRVAPEACAVCGYAPGGEDTSKPDKVVGLALKPYHRLRETDDDGMRALRLSRWIAEAQRRTFKDGWWRAKFQAVYGHWPSGAVLDEARSLLARQKPVDGEGVAP